ncbi:MAG: molybdenum cofactor biosynthesis protein MoaE [Bacteroidetes bacterium]|nr:molybdenum cofactor biosynthesis protein MoaE [Rhodothermia bacterium]MCS7155277.1 molybdenum cofactor biosynthesis protein MoaE [Bacteroidota bacterium]MCX7907862.1 molybdenum cofactor biosynthesis protein MoaE [Bacteroidota bacterium]MDW8138681.1 molybdenum cofactor biosynthesis protein MoaE [Bacteroidota bacterium]MDW8284733.1 molybdenum cofactor biosynthesis protein MoaE [Bacteroidota bacterium]
MDPIRVSVQEEPLDWPALVRWAVVPKSGAVELFLGVARRITDGRETLELRYTAYVSMAEAELRRIAQEALERFPICRVAVAHRLGLVPAGEPSVAVVVSAPHRDGAFSACRYVIEALKVRAPIWKQERTATGLHWAPGTPIPEHEPAQGQP